MTQFGAFYPPSIFQVAGLPRAHQRAAELLLSSGLLYALMRVWISELRFAVPGAGTQQDGAGAVWGVGSAGGYHHGKAAGRNSACHLRHGHVWLCF